MTLMRLCIYLCPAFQISAITPEASSQLQHSARDMNAVYFVLIFAALTGAATCLFSRKYIYVDLPMTWIGAQNYCRINYVDLATITSQKELESFNKEVNVLLPIWIGLSKDLDVMEFVRWSDGSALGFTKWSIGEPNNYLMEHCVSSVIGEWHDFPCMPLQSFTCYTWEPQVIMVQEMKTWNEALKYCRTFYTDLISLPKTRDLDLSKNMTSTFQTPSFWIGLRFLDGSWFWLDKESMEDIMPSCPDLSLRCGAKQTAADVFENRDCEEKMNFVCYNKTV